VARGHGDPDEQYGLDVSRPVLQPVSKIFGESAQRLSSGHIVEITGFARVRRRKYMFLPMAGWVFQRIACEVKCASNRSEVVGAVEVSEIREREPGA